MASPPQGPEELEAAIAARAGARRFGPECAVCNFLAASGHDPDLLSLIASMVDDPKVRTVDLVAALRDDLELVDFPEHTMNRHRNYGCTARRKARPRAQDAR